MSKKTSAFDGIYSAYFTGAMGVSFGLFVFKEGIIAGADAGEGKYDGDYVISEDNLTLTGSVQFTIPIGHQTITGASATTEPITFKVPIKLPTIFNQDDIHRIETPAGPINAKFEKLRGF